MSIQKTVLGFEPTNSRMPASSHDHWTSAPSPANPFVLFKLRPNGLSLHLSPTNNIYHCRTNCTQGNGNHHHHLATK